VRTKPALVARLPQQTLAVWEVKHRGRKCHAREVSNKTHGESSPQQSKGGLSQPITHKIVKLWFGQQRVSQQPEEAAWVDCKLVSGFPAQFERVGVFTDR
jgi:hypothetical protein